MERIKYKSPDDNYLLEEFMDMTRIYRNKGISKEERKRYKALCEEIKRRKLL